MTAPAACFDGEVERPVTTVIARLNWLSGLWNMDISR